jgi:hypothetical protein
VTGLDLRTLTGAGCTLDEGGWERQRDRIHRLREHVADVAEDGAVLRIQFDDGVDRGLVDDFVATEGVCCGFLSLGYDERERVLRIASDDAQSWDVVRGFAAVFSRAAA